MRKLLTMMAAVASAMGLYAADSGKLSGTSFEGFDAETDLDISSSTGELIENTSGYWVTNGTETLKIKAGTSVQYDDSPNRSPAFRGLDNEKYLSIKTESVTNAISRYVLPTGTTVNINGGTDETKGLYFDSYVRFTAFDSDPQIDLGSNGKLAIWLRESFDAEDKPTATNLVITAGYLDTSLEARVRVTNYNCQVVGGINFNDGDWHRVTVKALDSIYAGGVATPGFVVFVDRSYVRCTDDTDMGISGTLTGTASSWNGVNALFPSAYQYGQGVGTIAAVDFAGQGDVDELVFTRNAPFDAAKDVGIFTIRIPAAGNGVESVTFTTNGVEETINVAETATTKTFAITDNLKSQGIKIVGNYTTGYMKGNWTGGLDPNASGYYTQMVDGDFVGVVAKKAAAVVDGVPYETLAEAIAVANVADSDCKVSLADAATYDIVINNSDENANITIDLAGNTITGTTSGYATIYVEAGTVTITNSTGIGTVQAAENEGMLGAAVFGLSTVAIQDGVYNGTVYVMGRTITGGAFLATYGSGAEPQVVNAEDTLNTMIVDGCVASLADNYYTLTEAAPTYTVTFNTDGGSVVPAIPDQSVDANGYATDPGVTPVKNHYEFQYWSADGSTEFDFANTPIVANTTLIAVYTAVNYTVTFDTDGGSVVPAIPDQSVAYNGYATDPNVTPVKNHYEFQYWSADGSTEFDFANTPIVANTTLTAVYTVMNYTVTFMYDNVTEFDTKTTAYNTVLAVKPQNPTKADYTFEGWSTDGTVANVVNLDEYLVVADVTLYAVWSQVQTDPIPAIDAGATAEQVAAAIAQAGFTDTGVATLINGDAATYLAFKAWADTVTGGGSSESTVVNSSHAAISYKLKDVVASPTLFTSAPEVSVTAVTPGTNCAVTFELKNGESTVTMSDAVSAYVGKILKGTSPTSLTACTTDDVAGVAVDENGKATVTLTKPSATAGFFKFDVE